MPFKKRVVCLRSIRSYYCHRLNVTVFYFIQAVDWYAIICPSIIFIPFQLHKSFIISFISSRNSLQIIFLIYFVIKTICYLHTHLLCVFFFVFCFFFFFVFLGFNTLHYNLGNTFDLAFPPHSECFFISTFGLNSLKT